MEKSELNLTSAFNWNKLCKAGGVSAFLIVAIIPIQLVLFTLFPPPDTTMGFLELFSTNWFIGLLSLDFLYYINNGLLIVVYLGLFAALRNVDVALMLVALSVGFIGIAVYYVSAIGFEMLSVSQQYFGTDSIELKQQLLSVGHGLLARYRGTAFDVYYVFNAVALLLMSITLYSSKDFTKSTATWGLLAAILMLIPSTAGTLGLVFSLLSLIPWIVFSILIGRKLMRLGGN